MRGTVTKSHASSCIQSAENQNEQHFPTALNVKNGTNLNLLEILKCKAKKWWCIRYVASTLDKKEKKTPKIAKNLPYQY